MTQSEQLKRGLAKLGPGFAAELCGVCDGAGEHVQIYTVGCGGGSYGSMGPCSWCRDKTAWYGVGSGLVIGRDPAPLSVANQVMEAGK